MKVEENKVSVWLQQLELFSVFKMRKMKTILKTCLVMHFKNCFLETFLELSC